MLSSVAELQPLLEEAQLGSRLNEDVHSGKRADFSLLLSMLTDDVRAHSQFALPADELDNPETDDIMLRKQFSLPDKEPLALSSVDEITQFEQAGLVAEGRMTQLHLENCLQQKALSFRDDAKHVVSKVLENTSLHCQLKHQNVTPEQRQRKAFDAKGFVTSIQQSLVAAPLIA